MKFLKPTITDILFIIISAVLLLILTEFGYSELISKFSFIFVLVAYFAGKYLKS